MLGADVRFTVISGTTRSNGSRAHLTGLLLSPAAATFLFSIGWPFQLLPYLILGSSPGHNLALGAKN